MAENGGESIFYIQPWARGINQNYKESNFSLFLFNSYCFEPSVRNTEAISTNSE